MSQAASLAHIFRHPIKAHGREELASVQLFAGEAMPWDRHWAVAHDLSKFSADSPAWMPCINFQRAARSPALMAIEARFDDRTGVMELRHPALAPLRFHPETEGDRLVEWVRPISPQERFRPVSLVRAPGRAMTDTAFPSISVKNLASNRALGEKVGRDLSIHRWRGNLWIDGLAPWAEMGWIGRRLRIGEVVLEICEPVGRCRATMANPETGEVDVDTLEALKEAVGVQDFGVFGTVLEGGEIRPGDHVEVLA
ncbi:MOSC domain-containing protein [Xinfangfangia sp. D13-10-4-6]|uniref:MOSC domain-containing protein n=1 Tax=Pseudogemmobacter hezensis TaxID=2737662 RepID=UPI001557264A|nr:MOSC domain-containing protein [Pseudogemmobacter hezensis]NPD17241.1 MOSC domain-containing protein [Pseudogemmobacter hezensis]